MTFVAESESAIAISKLHVISILYDLYQGIRTLALIDIFKAYMQFLTCTLSVSLGSIGSNTSIYFIPPHTPKHYIQSPFLPPLAGAPFLPSFITYIILHRQSRMPCHATQRNVKKGGYHKSVLCHSLCQMRLENGKGKHYGLSGETQA